MEHLFHTLHPWMTWFRLKMLQWQLMDWNGCGLRYWEENITINRLKDMMKLITVNREKCKKIWCDYGLLRLCPVILMCKINRFLMHNVIGDNTWKYWVRGWISAIIPVRMLVGRKWHHSSWDAARIGKCWKGLLPIWLIYWIPFDGICQYGRTHSESIFFFQFFQHGYCS